MYAIVTTGGKQYKVAEGDTIAVEKLDVEPGNTVGLDVIFLADGSRIDTDAESIEKAKVFAEVVEHFKGDKALVFKFKKRKGYKRLNGHRQELTRLLVQSISPTGEEPKKKAEPKKTEKPSKVQEASAEDAKDEKDLTVEEPEKDQAVEEAEKDTEAVKAENPVEIQAADETDAAEDMDQTETAELEETKPLEGEASEDPEKPEE